MTTLVTVGDAAPDLSLENQDGVAIQLSWYWMQTPVVLVFLRHFGCPHCRAQVRALFEAKTMLASANLKPLLVGLGTPIRARQFQRETGITFTVLADPTKRSYAAYGLHAMNILRQLSPEAITHFVKDFTTAGGTGISVDQDMLQLGGTFIVDTAGVIRFGYRSLLIADRPDITDLIACGQALRDEAPVLNASAASFL